STKASGGAAWTNISPSGISARVVDFEISSTGRLHICTGIISSVGGYRFTDNPSTVASATWTSATTAFPYPVFNPATGANNRVEIGCSGNTLYALISNATNNVSGAGS